MSAHAQANALSFKADGVIAKGQAVKGGTDGAHVAKSVLATNKSIGLALCAAAAAEDVVEVAMPGGGAKGLLAGTVAFGDLLAPDSSGSLVATTTTSDRHVAIAMEAGVAGDLISVHVVCGQV